MPLTLSPRTPTVLTLVARSTTSLTLAPIAGGTITSVVGVYGQGVYGTATYS